MGGSAVGDQGGPLWKYLLAQLARINFGVPFDVFLQLSIGCECFGALRTRKRSRYLVGLGAVLRQLAGLSKRLATNIARKHCRLLVVRLQVPLQLVSEGKGSRAKFTRKLSGRSGFLVDERVSLEVIGADKRLFALVALVRADALMGVHVIGEFGGPAE